MTIKFPAVEPFESGLLDVSDGHRVYFECVGQPGGKPALFLHGGPGSGCSLGARSFFDPAVYCAVLFDQRGTGRSRPLASDVDADLSTNTTANLIADIERLREHLGIERWAVLALSWGTTLALAYAQTHPKQVSALVLALVTTTSRREVDWITREVGCLFPREWRRFADAVPDSLRHLPLVDAYATLLFDHDRDVREHAAREWCAWEDAHVSLTPAHVPNPRFENAEFRLRFARLVTHYWRHAAFLEEEQLLRDAPILDGIPGILIHGRYDVSSPLETAWRLSQRWSTSHLHLLDDAGHGGGDTFFGTVTGALNRMATL